jgi:predicted GIY-YIG superfamily endonuclease
MKGQIEIPKNVKPIKVEFDEQIIPPSNLEPAVSPPTGGPIIPPPKVPTVDPPAIDNTDKEFDEKIQDLEKKVASIKNSETAKKVKDSWDNLWVDVKDSAADAQTQLKILLLKQKIDAAARKVTPSGQTMNFVDCTGWNTLGCKSDSIKKVQNCMDIGVSGNFDEFLKSELARYKSTYAFREGFSDSDVQKICAYKQEENRQEALKREQLAKQAQKAAEIQAFERKYPQVFTPATERDEF